jgi:hypothetical protein
MTVHGAPDQMPEHHAHRNHADRTRETVSDPTIWHDDIVHPVREEYRNG